MRGGELDDLPGKGKPLAMDENLSWVPDELRIAYKVLKNAGFVPPEVELRKEIVSLRETLVRLEDDEQRRALSRKLDFKLLKLNMMRKRPLNLEDFPAYRDKIIDRLGGCWSASIALPMLFLRWLLHLFSFRRFNFLEQFIADRLLFSSDQTPRPRWATRRKMQYA